jgi:hypothetical protein
VFSQYLLEGHWLCEEHAQKPQEHVPEAQTLPTRPQSSPPASLFLHVPSCVGLTLSQNFPLPQWLSVVHRHTLAMGSQRLDLQWLPLTQVWPTLALLGA